METGQRIESYDWRGGREAMLRFGPDDGPVIVLALPLFEEANRTRAFGAGLLRELAARGIGGVLPEWPGQGESEGATVEARLADWHAAFAAAPGTHAVAIRSGALVVDGRPGWLLSPQDGASLMREQARVKGGALEGDVVEVGGNLLSRALREALFTAACHPRGDGDRIVRLDGDPRPADRHVEGRPLWRRAEPDNDLPLAELLASDIAQWIAPCGG